MQQIRLLDDFSLRFGGFRLSLYDFARGCGGELCELPLQSDQGFAGTEYFDGLPSAMPMPIAVPMLGFGLRQWLFDAEGHPQVGGEFADLLVGINLRVNLRADCRNRCRGERVDDIRPRTGTGHLRADWRTFPRAFLRIVIRQVRMPHLPGSGQIRVSFVNRLADCPRGVGGGHELDAQRLRQGFDHAEQQFVKQTGHVPCELLRRQP